ncbi:glycerol-3-phosphate dehydrogenase (NAD(P)+) [Rhodobacter aestuarii]|uniref:Glycerol-3-phosphate dehydrogenase [NAD(P)+] n=1 Tax=Rhodobacter aestuarii TaxID=453582 RepID=A0A1N7LL62_9RHOB|nr:MULTISPECIES: NAD(P)H-dependent glycerol-3-phosphate dehydrogenase [Rhodobacter]PTV95181.1 glycerol-3-phosphate dehydrogenase (NAD(P)+) [Rhodobacter aestuarii]SIS74588.1 glycerol-3-phosphate dehydrogenase (NAD(P)+) [Rhodobacter aestuarii]SOC07741.1 glycerol-3-phosphate dehydrogenase (NAD(P)+) [Rhodobacter sp. JA431]
MSIAVLGAGAFGTALAITLAQIGEVVLWARDTAHAEDMQQSRCNARRLPDAHFPQRLSVTSDIACVDGVDIVLLAMPMQQMGGFLASHAARLDGKTLISCSKGIDLATGNGPIEVIEAACPKATAAVLTGPSFAADIARGLPTALTLATREDASALQAQLSTPTLRIYRTTDTIGAELGGALKNVIAIAAGVVIGAQLGDSARAALMTRGFAEMGRLALKLGARPETLDGLSGFGDLVLTCTSAQSRNFRFGLALGKGEDFDPATTVEGAATARAAVQLGQRHGVDLPITAMVAALVAKDLSVSDAAAALLSRPLKEE